MTTRINDIAGWYNIGRQASSPAEAPRQRRKTPMKRRIFATEVRSTLDTVSNCEPGRASHTIRETDESRETWSDGVRRGVVRLTPEFDISRGAAGQQQAQIFERLKMAVQPKIRFITPDAARRHARRPVGRGLRRGQGHTAPPISNRPVRTLAVIRPRAVTPDWDRRRLASTTTGAPPRRTRSLPQLRTATRLAETRTPNPMHKHRKKQV